MIDLTQINCVFFDFDGTLCSERYFATFGTEVLNVVGQRIFGEGSAEWAEPWMRGDLTSRDIAVYLSKHLTVSADNILAALHNGCSNLTFHPSVCRFAQGLRAAGRKTALITVNMDIFTEVVVPAHGLDRLFDLVLNTADHHTLDKSILWHKAFEVFGPQYSFNSTLLIDDRQEMVSLFASLGGNSYQYRGDDEFESWSGGF